MQTDFCARNCCRQSWFRWGMQTRAKMDGGLMGNRQKNCPLRGNQEEFEEYL